MATGSMDNTAKLWDVETGQDLSTLAVKFSHQIKSSQLGYPVISCFVVFVMSSVFRKLI